MYQHFKATASPPLVRPRRAGGGLFLAASDLLLRRWRSQGPGCFWETTTLTSHGLAITCRSRSSSLARVHSGSGARQLHDAAGYLCREERKHSPDRPRLGGLQARLLTTGRFIGPKHGQQDVRPCLSDRNLHTSTVSLFGGICPLTRRSDMAIPLVPDASARKNRESCPTDYDGSVFPQEMMIARASSTHSRFFFGP